MSISNISLSSFSLDQNPSTLYWTGLAVGLGTVALVTRVCLSRLASPSRPPRSRSDLAPRAAVVRAATPAASAAAAAAPPPVEKARVIEILTADLNKVREIINCSESHYQEQELHKLGYSSFLANLDSSFHAMELECSEILSKGGTLKRLIELNHDQAAERFLAQLNEQVGKGQQASVALLEKFDSFFAEIDAIQDRLPERVKDSTAFLVSELQKERKDVELIVFLTTALVRKKLGELKDALTQFQGFWASQTITLDNFEGKEEAWERFKQISADARGAVSEIRSQVDRDAARALAEALRSFRDGDPLG